jgi:UDP-N-acetylmuramoylalanine--D-glutamate ligase
MNSPGRAVRSSEFAGRHVLVCGAGVAGAPAVRALLRVGARVSIADARRGPSIDALEAQGAAYLGEVGIVPADVDVVVTSPGWSPGTPLLVDAVARAVPVHGEVELAWRLRGADGTPAAPWLAVTGTNGKTTTVRMLESMLTAHGERALAVGNVGVSIIDAVMAGSGPGGYDVLSVEVSSFQLHWSSTVAVAAGAVINLAPDHLDWHGSMDAYAEAKSRLLRGDVAIGWMGDPAVTAMLRAAPGRQIAVTLGRPGPGELGVIDGRLADRAFIDADADADSDADAVLLAEAASVRPSGQHNVLNALVASALARSHGVTATAIEVGLARFVPDHHRNESLGDVPVPGGSVAIVDDSKATNPHAAQASLLAYEQIVWIAGGQLKGAPIEDLVQEVADRLVGVVLLGADRAVIAAALARHAPQVPVIDVPSKDDDVMIEVVRAAMVLAQPGSTILLAPAAASLDMFPSYSARGQAFAQAVRTWSAS